MNKNRYRIVFNKTRNLMMAVAENTKSQGKGRQSGSVQSASATSQPAGKVIQLFPLRPLVFAALCAFGLQPVLLHAAVTADANAAASNQRVFLIDSSSTIGANSEFPAPGKPGSLHLESRRHPEHLRRYLHVLFDLHGLGDRMDPPGVA